MPPPSARLLAMAEVQASSTGAESSPILAFTTRPCAVPGMSKVMKPRALAPGSSWPDAFALGVVFQSGSDTPRPSRSTAASPR